METAEFIETLRREGRLLGDTAERVGLDSPVPSCSDWRVRDLVRHTGAVHRWATAYVVEGRTGYVPVDETAPGDDKLVDWYRESHGTLTDALTSTPADLACFHFFAAPSPLAFWARRQAHETTIHRVDAEIALGPAAPTPVETVFAADGVHELLAGFHSRQRSKVRTDRPRTLRVRATDVPDADWLVRLSPEAPTVEPVPAAVEGALPDPADCTLSGPAADLYLALWNRGPYNGLTVRGDVALVELWQETAAIG